MTDIVHRIFTNKKINPTKLTLFGFEQKSDCYVFSKILSNSGFELTIRITTQDDVTTEILDPLTHEPYTLHLVDGATGNFVGKIKKQYEEALVEIANQCFEPNVFKSKQAKELIFYVRNTYGNELEFLWKKFSNNAVWRRDDTQKWYGVLLTVSKRKLGINSDEIVEIIDLRMQPEELKALLDHKKYFPGYHMHKKTWYTIILNSSVDFVEICRRIDKSYLLATK